MASKKSKVRSIGHIEIEVTDLKKAKSFYEKLFGWDVKKPALDNYAFFSDGKTSGGFNKVNKKSKGNGVTLYVGVEDMTKTLEKAEKLGGKTVTPHTKIPGEIDCGYYGQFKDPFGNIMGLWSEK